MIEHKLSFVLPAPWKNVTFEIERFGAINYLVGPNGSGKSRFAEALKQKLPNARLLGTDRLTGMGKSTGLGFMGDTFADGFRKNLFGNIRVAGQNFGSGLDTFLLLEERPDIRILVEATLSHLFNRAIYLEWDSGNLIPKAILGSSGASYRIDRDECHGIRELMVLLTHLYNDQHPYLIIDEPELNLHPQFQAFLMQEIRKVAGDPVPGTRRKAVFLITHSPFIIDIRSITDLKSILSFDLQHSAPRSLADIDEPATQRLSSLVPRLNVHHKQLFFSDNPIFVEGILDVQIVEAIQEQRNVSITAAGSCLIDAGGCEEVIKYLELCRGFGKRAFFFYDLDSLFTGNLRQCIKSETEVTAFLADLGLGGDFAKYCGELDRRLTDAIDVIRKCDDLEVANLRRYLDGLAEEGRLRDKRLQKARVAVLVDLDRSPETIAMAVSQAAISDIQGRLNRIIEVLRGVNVILLRGGALEHYLPSYCGDPYELKDATKRAAVEMEVALLTSGAVTDLKIQYRGLFDGITQLPAKPPVDTDSVLIKYLSDYVHELQGLVLSQPAWTAVEFNTHFGSVASGLGRLFKVDVFNRTDNSEFTATISISGPTAIRRACVDHNTNAGMRKFAIESISVE
jgi:predicted ATPase